MEEKLFRYDGRTYKAEYQLNIDFLSVYLIEGAGSWIQVYTIEGKGSMDAAIQALLPRLA